MNGENLFGGIILKSLFSLVYQEFSTSGHAYTDTGKASGNLETKYKVCDYGLTFTQKWNTDNTLGTEISWENKVRKSSGRYL